MAFVGYLRLNPNEMVGIASKATTLDGRYLENSRKIETLGDGVVVAVIGNEDLAGRILREMRPRFSGVPYQRIVEGLTAACSGSLQRFFEDAYLMPQHGITHEDYVAIKETGRKRDGTPFKGSIDGVKDVDTRFRNQAYRLFIGGVDGDDVSQQIVFPDGGIQRASNYWFLGLSEKESTVRLGDKLREARIDGQGPIPYPVGVRLMMETLREEYWLHRDAETGTQLVHVKRGQPVEDVDWRRVVLLHNVLTFQGRGHLAPEERDSVFENLLEIGTQELTSMITASYRTSERAAAADINSDVKRIAEEKLADTKAQVKLLAGVREGDMIADALDDDRFILIK